MNPRLSSTADFFVTGYLFFRLDKGNNRFFSSSGITPSQVKIIINMCGTNKSLKFNKILDILYGEV